MQAAVKAASEKSAQQKYEGRIEGLETKLRGLRSQIQEYADMYGFFPVFTVENVCGEGLRWHLSSDVLC